MADIKVVFCDGVIIETEEAIELGPPRMAVEDLSSITEAFNLMLTAVHEKMTSAAVVTIDDLFFIGATITKGLVRVKVIHTPAADAYLDEFEPGWRHALELPILAN